MNNTKRQFIETVLVRNQEKQEEYEHKKNGVSVNSRMKKHVSSFSAQLPYVFSGKCLIISKSFKKKSGKGGKEDFKTE